MDHPTLFSILQHKRTLESSAVEDEGPQLKLGRARGVDWAELLQSPLVREELTSAVARCVARRARGGKGEQGRRASQDTIAFLKELSRTLEPAALRLVLDGFAIARAEDTQIRRELHALGVDVEEHYLFHGLVDVGVERIDLLTEASVSGLTDERVVELSQLMLEHEAAGPPFFLYGFIGLFSNNSCLRQALGQLASWLSLAWSCHW
jgi:hypothetical protein